jgi:hypothetical protein
MRSIALLSTLIWRAAVAQFPTFCDLDVYYSGLPDRGLSRWTRDDVVILLETSHTQFAPFVGANPGDGDVLEALMELDGGTDGSDTIHLMYLNADAPNLPLDRSMWVAEHIMPIFMTSSYGNNFDYAFSDLHNLRPSSPDLHESIRGTLYFGVCPASNCQVPLNAESDTCACGDTFQPPESARGIIARALLYMQLRYNAIELSNCHLEQLLAWHSIYPPSSDEVSRNERVCRKFQGDRNPFVDHPNLAWELDIHKTDCEEGHSDEQIGEGSSSPVDFDDLVTNEGGDWNEETSDEKADFIDNIFDGDKHAELEDGETFDPCANMLEDGLFRAWRFGIDTVDCGGTDEEIKDEELGGKIDNLFSLDELDASIDSCSDLLPGDLYIYMLQTSPARVGMIALVDLPSGLELYLANGLDNSKPYSKMRLTLEDGRSAGNPFGYGRNMILGEEWQVLTQPISVQGAGNGGDELFVYCNDSNDDTYIQVLTAFSTHGMFEAPLPDDLGSYGVVVLEEPMDYYVYNGPLYTRNDDYQKALLDPTNWLGIQSTSPSPTAAPSATPQKHNSKIEEVNRASSSSSLLLRIRPLSWLAILHVLYTFA